MPSFIIHNENKGALELGMMADLGLSFIFAAATTGVAALAVTVAADTGIFGGVCAVLMVSFGVVVLVATGVELTAIKFKPVSFLAGAIAGLALVFGTAIADLDKNKLSCCGTNGTAS